jgi:hypothetical protein
MSMTGAGVQALISQGLGVAAQSIGSPHAQFRPSGATVLDPLNAGNNIGTLNALFTLQGGMKPSAWTAQTKAEQPYWQIIANLSALQIGDCLVDTHTYCVVALDALMVPLALRCPHSVTVTRPTIDTEYGARPYNAINTRAETVVATNVPAYIQAKTFRGTPPTKLPDDTGLNAYYEVSLWLPDGTIQPRDFLTDDNGRRFHVTGGPFSLLGYTLLCELLEA